MTVRLGVNIDHVATLRNARGETYPDPLRAAGCVAAGGAQSLTVHLREDRRHIRDADVARLITGQSLPVNLEMAPTPEMVAIALEQGPAFCCLVPERRAELTTEGGLDVAALSESLADPVGRLMAAGIRVSLFVDPDQAQIEAAQALGVPCIELHTGAYAAVAGQAAEQELKRLARAAALAAKSGLECHAGHGLTYDNVAPVAGVPAVCELNIGHFLVSEAVFLGLEAAVRRMITILTTARP